MDDLRHSRYMCIEHHTDERIFTNSTDIMSLWLDVICRVVDCDYRITVKIWDDEDREYRDLSQRERDYVLRQTTHIV